MPTGKAISFHSKSAWGRGVRRGISISRFKANKVRYGLSKSGQTKKAQGAYAVQKSLSRSSRKFNKGHY